jgi:sporulation protein YlmC with PRC-barrel domain
MNHYRHLEAAMSEAQTLIYASKVNGTSVYDPDGSKIGAVEDIAIDKLSGEVAYAVLALGGFLGIGEKYTPIPWHLLDYDPDEDGYVIGLSKEQLQDAPSYDKKELADTGDETYRDEVDEYYGADELEDEDEDEE